MDAARQKRAAKKFVECWAFRRGSEKGEDQQFWNMLLRDVLGVEDVEKCIRYQVPVPMKDTVKFLDAWIPATRTLVEHKSRGVDLDAPQAGHDGKTPLEQAEEYDNARGFDEKARWIVLCNFDEFRIHDRAKPLAAPMKVRLCDLPKEAHRLAFLADRAEKPADRELEISVQAGRIVGEIYDALLEQYGEADAEKAGARLAALNRLCVRLVFCLYAEDAGVFPKDCFRRLLDETPAVFLRERLLRLFQTLDTPPEKRSAWLEPQLAAFPYTNGGLFSGGDGDDIPPLSGKVREMLLGASRFDWRDITPTIFGALFESTLNPATRRAGGMVYTSVENIHKVIDPLFLDDLARQVEEATKGTQATKGALSAKSRSSLSSLQSLLASLTFLDPACGSGNFLTETYICLRRLENRIIAALQRGQGELDLGLSAKVSISQFCGIEINDFAVAVAKTALWIAEAQMRQETAEILHREPDYLPLKDYAGIVEGNALKMDWPRADYIMGNPPFVGARNKSKEQAADMEDVFGADWKGLGNLDYVTAWYKKAADCMGGPTSVSAKAGTEPGPPARCAFVSTNSICQGDGVASLWRPLFGQGLEIDFAHRTFRWDNEAAASEKAHVHCVIVGFHVAGGPASVPATAGTEPGPPKTIFDGERAIPATHINAYLMNAQDVWIESRSKPLCDVTEMGIGNKPIDGGNYLFTEEEKTAFLKKEPKAAPYFHPWYGSYEFIHNEPRWCLWLGDCSPHELREMPQCLKRVAAVRDFRLASKSAGTRKIASKPTRFHVENFPKSDYIVVPSVSSERREYVPMGFFTPDVICSNLVLIIPGATLYHFGVLTSSVHMAWMRAVAGRLKSDYRYSAAIVYNNFPWPEKGTEETKGTKETSLSSFESLSSLVSQTAQAILDARAAYPDASLADLYDPLTMPADLRAAHAANDKAVLAAYGLAPDATEQEIVAHLFALYKKKDSSL